MTYKNLLVSLDGTKSSAKRVKVALDLAERFDAHLTGLHVDQKVIIPSYVMAGIPEAVQREQRAVRKAEADRIVEAFEAAATRAGRRIESRRASAPGEDVAEIIGLHGRYADLVILGQHDDADPESWGHDIVEHSLLTLGRPCLVVPYIGAPAAIGKRVVIAWDAGREAARAVYDALPFLKEAEAVHVVAVNPARTGRDIGHGQEPGADIALALARHGVKAEAHHIVAEDIQAADTLLSRLSDMDADLLVMGAYGHTRWRDLVLGGVTRSILAHMTVPVLMSH
jgi:nucleotide-binding universal stress UspA family protein